MKFKLTKHAKDSAMVEATYTWNDRTGHENILLAFVMHEDCIEDDDIKNRLADGDSVEVEMKLC